MCEHNHKAWEGILKNQKLGGLLLVSVLGLVACGGGSDNADSQTDNNGVSGSLEDAVVAHFIALRAPSLDAFDLEHLYFDEMRAQAGRGEMPCPGGAPSGSFSAEGSSSPSDESFYAVWTDCFDEQGNPSPIGQLRFVGSKSSSQSYGEPGTTLETFIGSSMISLDENGDRERVIGVESYFSDTGYDEDGTAFITEIAGNIDFGIPEGECFVDEFFVWQREGNAGSRGALFDAVGEDLVCPAPGGFVLTSRRDVEVSESVAGSCLRSGKYTITTLSPGLSSGQSVGPFDGLEVLLSYPAGESRVTVNAARGEYLFETASGNRSVSSLEYLTIVSQACN